jgi:hypothetical protein
MGASFNGALAKSFWLIVDVLLEAGRSFEKINDPVSDECDFGSRLGLKNVSSWSSLKCLRRIYNWRPKDRRTY